MRLSNISEDPALYLPPSNTPLGGVPLSRRLPCGNDERIRRVVPIPPLARLTPLHHIQTLQFYFILRKFAFDLSGEQETTLPLSSNMQTMAEINDCINLSR